MNTVVVNSAQDTRIVFHLPEEIDGYLSSRFIDNPMTAQVHWSIWQRTTLHLRVDSKEVKGYLPYHTSLCPAQTLILITCSNDSSGTSSPADISRSQGSCLPSDHSYFVHLWKHVGGEVGKWAKALVIFHMCGKLLVGYNCARNISICNCWSIHVY